MLAYRESVKLLDHYGLPRPFGVLVRTAEEAVEEVGRLQVPAALKLISRRFPHKSRAGLVRLDVAGREQARAAVDALLSATAAHSGEDPHSEVVEPADCEGILVQPMIRGELELFLGAIVDEQFGPIVAFGPGGILVEYLDGIDFARPPITPHHLRMFIERNAVYPIMARSASDRGPLVEGVARLLHGLARLICDLAGEISAVDLNPVVFPRGSPEPVILDLRVEGRIDHGQH